MTPLDYALHYTEALGWAVVPIEPGQKGPTGNRWNQPGGYIHSTNQALRYWQHHPHMGMGLVHGPSHTAVLDIDRPEWWELLGIKVSSPVEIQGRKFAKPLFRVPAGLNLKRHALQWPDPENLKSRVCIFELRAGLVQDVLPPSLHPAGMNYSWAGPMPQEPEDIPELPDHLIELWLNWNERKEGLEALCPWAPARPQRVITARVDNMEGERPQHIGGGIIEAYNRHATVGQILERNGYVPRGAKRWMAPGSSTGLAGVTELEPGRVFSHHGSDVLANGHAHDAFSLLCVLECAGDLGEAIKQAKAVVGWEGKRVKLASVGPKRRSEIPPELRVERLAPRRINHA